MYVLKLENKDILSSFPSQIKKKNQKNITLYYNILIIIISPYILYGAFVRPCVVSELTRLF